jgi:hypothetical protein
MTLAEIFADKENLPAGVEAIVLNGESFAHWEITSDDTYMSVTLWCNRTVMLSAHEKSEDVRPGVSIILTAEQMIWLGSLPQKLTA